MLKQLHAGLQQLTSYFATAGHARLGRCTRPCFPSSIILLNVP